ncbi:phospholipid phosphatase 1-like isoform X2 [Babylonia areolata]|uniref:phospholipid phosphatase 1-like isoform X2 n=1 Tax=Babylonia areolata TaxID=304850 RepID=UPI003FCF70A9
MVRKREILRIFFNIVCLSIVGATVLVIHLAAKPFHRGFFCDDQSLMHPYSKKDTVPIWSVAVVGLGLTIVSILLVECLPQSECCCELVPREIGKVPKSWLHASYRTILVFLFGAAVTQLLTEIGKVSIGRLRPHFLDACKPQNLPADCSKVFITDNVCTGEESVVKEARLSFPSGHSSMAVYFATFLMFYLQGRLVCRTVKMVRPFLQVAVFCMAFYTCLSRVSDYKHHWSDVLGGALLGTFVCYLTMVWLGDFHYLSLQRTLAALQEYHKEELPMYRHQDTSTSIASGDADSPRDSSIQVHVQK